MFEPLRKKRENKIFNKRNVLGFVIIIVMVSSLLAVWEGNSTPLEAYNGHNFKYKNNNVYTTINDKEVAFNYHPVDIENITLPTITYLTLRDSKMIYLTFNPEDELIKDIEATRLELSKYLSSEFNIFVYEGVMYNHSLYPQMPIIGCENATQFIPIIILEKSNQTEIIQENSCIYLHAVYNYEFNGLIDRVRYGLYNIIK